MPGVYAEPVKKPKIKIASVVNLGCHNYDLRFWITVETTRRVVYGLDLPRL